MLLYSFPIADTLKSTKAGCFSVPCLLPRPLITIKQFLGYYVEPDDDPDQKEKLRQDKMEALLLSRREGYVEIVEKAYEPLEMRRACVSAQDETVFEIDDYMDPTENKLKKKKSLISRVKRRLHLNSRLRSAAMLRQARHASGQTAGHESAAQSPDIVSSEDISLANPVSRKDSGIGSDDDHLNDAQMRPWDAYDKKASSFLLDERLVMNPHSF